MRLSTFVLVIVQGALILSTAALHAADKPADLVSPAQATFSPGKETHIADSETGGLGYYVVWVPKDYTPEREWPLIICYHGKNGNPTSWPFRELTDEKSFIIVGMEYTDRESPKAETEVANLKRIHKFITSKLRVNPKLQFMGGFSQGGWSTSSFSNLFIDQLAGLIITGAGGGPGDKAAAVIKGRPVFIGIGENDPANPEAKKCRERYTDKGAVVTYEEFKGLAHAVDTKNKALKDWLVKWGPQNQMMAVLNQARAAEKNGHLGEAYTLYMNAAKMSGGEEAAEAGKAIGEPAEKKLSDADAALAAKKFPDAVKLYMSVAATYSGSIFADKARKQVEQIQTDPAIKAEIEQAKLDARAEAIESAAATAEKAKNYSQALSLYESYVKQFPKAAHYAAIKAHLDELKANKAITASARNQDADKECKGWLATADNYIQNNMSDKAKPYLQKILDKYADSTWAAEAKKRLENLK